MSYLNDSAMDALLNYIRTNATALYICSAEPTSYAEASSTYALGTKASPSIGAPAAGDASGRKITVAEITDGSCTATDTATHWAITSGSALLAAGALASSQAVSNGNTFTLTAFDIENPDPS